MDFLFLYSPDSPPVRPFLVSNEYLIDLLLSLCSFLNWNPVSSAKLVSLSRQRVGLLGERP